MTGWLQHEATAPILGTGISFPTEWGTLLAILLLVAVQAALAYRRGKVEPLPPGPSEQRRSPARESEPGPGRSGAQASHGAERRGRPGAALPLEKPPAIDRSLFLTEEEVRLRAAALPLLSPRPMASRKPSAAFLRRLRGPTGAREAFLGAEILWNPPVALRERGQPGV